jgi:hypothetical protein
VGVPTNLLSKRAVTLFGIQAPCCRRFRIQGYGLWCPLVSYSG